MPILESGRIVGDPLTWALRERGGVFLRFAAAFVGPDAAEDVTQSAYLKVFKEARLDSSNPAEVVAFIKRAVFWTAARHLRNEIRRKQGVESHLSANGAESLYTFDASHRPTDPAIVVEESDLIEKAFKILDGLEKVNGVQKARAEFFRKRYLDGLSSIEIAESSGTTQGTVFSGLNRITTQLQNAMNEIAA